MANGIGSMRDTGSINHMRSAISHPAMTVMHLYRTLLPTPLGEMLALSSDDGLCALEFTTVKGRARGEERLSRLNARLGRWFPPHQIVDRETPVIARARRGLQGYYAGPAAG